MMIMLLSCVDTSYHSTNVKCEWSITDVQCIAVLCVMAGHNAQQCHLFVIIVLTVYWQTSLSDHSTVMGDYTRLGFVQ